METEYEVSAMNKLGIGLLSLPSNAFDFNSRPHSKGSDFEIQAKKNKCFKIQLQKKNFLKGTYLATFT